MSGDASLDVMIATLRTIAGPSIVTAIAAEAALDVARALKTTAAAGTSPTGEPWAPTKDGGRPMQHAADHLDAKAVGGRVRVTLTGPDAWHNYGPRGEPVRQVIPATAAVPPVVADAAAKGAGRVFDRVMRAL